MNTAERLGNQTTDNQTTDNQTTDNQTYQKNTKIRWYRCKIDPAVMKELTRRSDWHGWRQSLGHLGLCVATGTTAYMIFLQMNSSNWYWWLLPLYMALFAHGTVCTFLGGTACHELMHRTPFKTKRLNDFFLRIFAFFGWWDHVWFRPSHIRHHQVTVHGDYDGEVVLPAKLGMEEWRFWLRIFAWDPVATWDMVKLYAKRAFGTMDNDWYEFVMPESNRKLRNEHRNWARFALFGHAALAVLFIATGHWFLIVIVNGRFYCNWLGLLCGVPQHFGLSPDTPDFRLCCRTYTSSWLPSFLYWNMQYHIEHHMFPAVPFFNLPKLRAAIEHDLPPAKGMWATWQEILEIRRKQLDDPAYVFVPELPNPIEERRGTRTEDGVLESEAALAFA
ncbi:MAG: fatty acid desaturase [Chloroflexota bacterium]